MSLVRRSALATAVVVSVLTLAACGSQLDPDEVAQAGGAGDTQGGTTAGDVPGAVMGAPDQAGARGGSTAAGAAGTTGATGSAGSAGSTGTTGDGGAGGGGDQGDGENAADGGNEAASCDGFKNQTGITDDKIVIANASDISGPVPGIFESAQQATRAYAAYFNSTGDICGRKLEVTLLDSRADAGADQQAYTKACAEAFAAVGSMSAFDSGGAGAAEGCGLPDIRSTSVNPERTQCSSCFSTQSVNVGLVPSVVPNFFLSKYKSSTEHVGLLYINAGAAPPNAVKFRDAWTKAGWNIDVFAGIDVSEFNFAPYVQQMKDADVDLVVYVGPYQNTVKLQQAMDQQDFDPTVFLQDATIYDERYVEQAGSLGDGTFVYSSTAMFDDPKNEEMALYRSWLSQVSPGAVPNYYGLYAWSAARLFVQEAVKLGGGLDRASLVAAFAKVEDWTSNGLHVPQQVGARTTYNCAQIIQLNGGTWSPVSGNGFQCGPLIDVGG
jgi:ABC-type branched-subunit amino acid transport system substrate-binding protein